MELTVISYGSGEILKSLFTSVAMLMNKDSGDLIRPLMILSGSIGGVWIATKAMFSGDVQSLLSKYFLPLLLASGVLMVPTTSVTIEDIIQNRSYRVDNVPLLLAKVSELFNTIGYQLTKGVEKVMHTPNDPGYLETGMIFGSETAMDMNQYRIKDGELQSNLSKFSKQCIVYDIALKRYSVSDLKKSTNLWDFLEKNTSKSTLVDICDGTVKEASKKCSFQSCPKALEKMKGQFKNEKNRYIKQEMFKNLNLTFNSLTDLQVDSQDLIGQQLMMNFLSDEYRGKNFAKVRAKQQQRNTYSILGSLASTSLITMRGVLEALVYAAFIFIVPLSLLPGGHSFLLTWMGLVAWIQIWPPFYAILNYIMQIIAKGRSGAFLSYLPVDEQGLSLMTIGDISALHEDIYAMAGYLSASIPFISYAVIKGGAGSFIHLSGAMMTPAHQAAGAAATELTTGNYSYGNVSLGNSTFGNISRNQENIAPSYTGGFIQNTDGGGTHVQSKNGSVLSERLSNTRMGAFLDEGFSNQESNVASQISSQIESSSESFSKDVSISSQESQSLSSALSSSENVREDFSEGEAQQFSKSVQNIESHAESFGKDHGITTSQAKEILLTAGISSDKAVLGKVVSKALGISGGASGSYKYGQTQQDTMRDAETFAKNNSIQESANTIKNFNQTEAYSSLQGKSKQLASNITESYSETQRSSDTLSKSVQNQTSFNNAVQQSRSDSVNFRENLGNEYHNGLIDKGYSPDDIFKPGFNHKPHMQEFIREKSSTYDQFLIKEEAGGLKKTDLGPITTVTKENYESRSGSLNKEGLEGDSYFSNKKGDLQKVLMSNQNTVANKINEEKEEMNVNKNLVKRKN
jgi:conjugal transfer mating pair stabilization protein TraG